MSARPVVRQVAGLPLLDEPAGRFDGFISTCVLDLLSDGDRRRVVAEADRVLTVGGWLCLASLTYGARPPCANRYEVALAAYAVHRLLVGGCRPVRLISYLQPGPWQVCHHEVVTERAVASDVVLAMKVAPEDSSLHFGSPALTVQV